MKWVLIFIIPGIALGQELRIIPANYSGSMASPWAFQKGDTLILEADSIYLVSQKRYDFYRKLHMDARENPDSLCQVIVDRYEAAVLEYDAEYHDLLELSKSQEAASLLLIQKLEKDLSESSKTLLETQNHLKESESNLEEAQSQLKKEKWNSAGKKIAIGAGGLILGVLLGIVIAL